MVILTVFAKRTWDEVNTYIRATELNRMEAGIFDAYFQSMGMFHEATVATPTYTGNNITQIDETVGGVLRRRTDLTYTGDKVNTIRVRVYDTSGTTVLKDYTDTFAYSGDNISSITRAVTV